MIPNFLLNTSEKQAQHGLIHQIFIPVPPYHSYFNNNKTIFELLSLVGPKILYYKCFHEHTKRYPWQMACKGMFIVCSSYILLLLFGRNMKILFHILFMKYRYLNIFLSGMLLVSKLCCKERKYFCDGLLKCMKACF